MSFNIRIAATASGRYLIGHEAITAAEREGEVIADRDHVCSTQLPYRCVAQFWNKKPRLCTPTYAESNGYTVLATYQDATHSRIRGKK